MRLFCLIRKDPVISFVAIFILSCHLGRPPEVNSGTRFTVDAWAVQPGVSQMIKHELTAESRRQGNAKQEEFDIVLTSVNEVPVVYMPEKGMLWLVELTVEIHSPNSVNPISFKGQANYIYSEGKGGFIQSRAQAYQSAAQQIALGAISVIHYQPTKDELPK